MKIADISARIFSFMVNKMNAADASAG